MGPARRGARFLQPRDDRSHRLPEEDARAYLTDYYAWLGEDIADFIVSAAAKDADAVEQSLAAFEEAGCQELFLFPSSSDPQQVDLLADAAGL